MPSNPFLDYAGSKKASRVSPNGETTNPFTAYAAQAPPSFPSPLESAGLAVDRFALGMIPGASEAASAYTGQLTPSENRVLEAGEAVAAPLMSNPFRHSGDFERDKPALRAEYEAEERAGAFTAEGSRVEVEPFTVRKQRIHDAVAQSPMGRAVLAGVTAIPIAFVEFGLGGLAMGGVVRALGAGEMAARATEDPIIAEIQGVTRRLAARRTVTHYASMAAQATVIGESELARQRLQDEANVPLSQYLETAGAGIVFGLALGKLTSHPATKRVQQAAPYLGAQAAHATAIARAISRDAGINPKQSATAVWNLLQDNASPYERQLAKATLDKNPKLAQTDLGTLLTDRAYGTPTFTIEPTAETLVVRTLGADGEKTLALRTGAEIRDLNKSVQRGESRILSASGTELQLNMLRRGGPPPTPRPKLPSPESIGVSTAPKGKIDAPFTRVEPVLVKAEAPSTTTLYRAEPSVAGKGVPEWMKTDPTYQAARAATGKWWVQDPKLLDFYLQDIPREQKPVVMRVDVPTADLEKYRVSNRPEAAKFSADPTNEFFLPNELAAAKTLHQGPTAPPPATFAAAADDIVDGPGGLKEKGFVPIQSGTATHSHNHPWMDAEATNTGEVPVLVPATQEKVLVSPSTETSPTAVPTDTSDTYRSHKVKQTPEAQNENLAAYSPTPIPAEMAFPPAPSFIQTLHDSVKLTPQVGKKLPTSELDEWINNRTRAGKGQRGKRWWGEVVGQVGHLSPDDPRLTPEAARAAENVLGQHLLDLHDSGHGNDPETLRLQQLLARLVAEWPEGFEGLRRGEELPHTTPRSSMQDTDGSILRAHDQGDGTTTLSQGRVAGTVTRVETKGSMGELAKPLAPDEPTFDFTDTAKLGAEAESHLFDNPPDVPTLRTAAVAAEHERIRVGTPTEGSTPPVERVVEAPPVFTYGTGNDPGAPIDDFEAERLRTPANRLTHPEMGAIPTFHEHVERMLRETRHHRIRYGTTASEARLLKAGLASADAQADYERKFGRLVNEALAARRKGPRGAIDPTSPWQVLDPTTDLLADFAKSLGHGPVERHPDGRVRVAVNLLGKRTRLTYPDSNAAAAGLAHLTNERAEIWRTAHEIERAVQTNRLPATATPDPTTDPLVHYNQVMGVGLDGSDAPLTAGERWAHFDMQHTTLLHTMEKWLGGLGKWGRVTVAHAYVYRDTLNALDAETEAAGKEFDRRAPNGKTRAIEPGTDVSGARAWDETYGKLGETRMRQGSDLDVEVGMRVNGRWVPHWYDLTETLSRADGKLVASFVNDLTENGLGTDHNSAWQAFVGLQNATDREAELKQATETMNRSRVSRGQAPLSRTEVEAKLGEWRKHAEAIAPNLQFDRKGGLAYSDNASAAARHAFARMNRLIADRIAFGTKMERQTAILDHIREEHGTAAAQKVLHFFDAMRGRNLLSSGMQNSRFNPLLQADRTYLSLSWLYHLPQNFFTASRFGWGQFTKGFFQTLKTYSSTADRQGALRFGAILRSTKERYYEGAVDPVAETRRTIPARLGDLMATPLHATVNFSRTVAWHVGQNVFDDLLPKAQANDPRAIKALNEMLGNEHATAENYRALVGGALDVARNRAGVRAADWAFFRFDPLSMPAALYEHPTFRLLMQFKNFLYPYTQLVAHELTARDVPWQRRARMMMNLGLLMPVYSYAHSRLREALGAGTKDTKRMVEVFDKLYSGDHRFASAIDTEFAAFAVQHATGLFEGVVDGLYNGNVQNLTQLGEGVPALSWLMTIGLSTRNATVGAYNWAEGKKALARYDAQKSAGGMGEVLAGSLGRGAIGKLVGKPQRPSSGRGRVKF